MAYLRVIQARKTCQIYGHVLRRTWRATCARCGKRTIAQACCFSITARADSIVVVDVTGSAEGTENRRLTLHVVSRGHVLSNTSTAPTLILKAPSTRSPSTMGRRGHNRRRGAGGGGPVTWTNSQRARGWRGPSVDAGTSRGASPMVCGIAHGRLHRAISTSGAQDSRLGTTGVNE